MTCDEFQAEVGGYALGALEPAERDACEAHLADSEHRGCEAALRRALATVAALSGALPRVAPSDGVWEAIQARTGALRAARRGSPVAWWMAMASAAAAVILLVLWSGARQEAARERAAAAAVERAATAQRAALEQELRGLQSTAAVQRELAALLDAPGSRLVSLGATPDHAGRATAVLDLAARRGLIVSTSLQPLPGRTYQLWVLRGTAPPRPAGFLVPAGSGVLAGQLDPALLTTAPDALAVSNEPAGGSPAPTDVQLVGKLVAG